MRKGGTIYLSDELIKRAERIRGDADKSNSIP